MHVLAKTCCNFLMALLDVGANLACFPAPPGARSSLMLSFGIPSPRQVQNGSG